ncbi:hypothetical protein WJX74_000949 [Apatococcus lobatus]|uniref:THO complex subunit 2 n=1 Tax=Apatococcus lobatus TaxID=904363 RepID=A0AAW1QWS8_9CHLO
MEVEAAQTVPEAQAPLKPLPEDELWYARIEDTSQPGAASDQQTVTRAKELLAKQEVSNQRLQETVDVEFLEELGLVADATRFKKLHIQTNTKMLYAQQKYNLLREESEGFGKAINALFQFGKAGLTLAAIPFLLRELRALIGYFDLDPIRLADIALEAFAADPKNIAFLELMQLFPRAALPHILGFKFKIAAEDQSAAFPGYASSLSLVAAQLIKARYIQLDALLPHLQPADATLQMSIAEGQRSFEVAADGILKSSLGGGKPEAPQEAKGLLALAVTAARLELAALPMEDAAFSAVGQGNHKLALTEGLLRVGAWPEASRMLVWLGGLGAPAAAHAGVRSALCQLLAQRLEPFHAWLHHNGLGGGPHQVDGTAPDISDETMDILHALGFRVASDPLLFQKVVKMVSFAVGRHVQPSGPSDSTSRITQLQNLLLDVVLPGLQLVPASVPVTAAVWQLLRQLPYRQRFCIYARWQGVQTEQVLLYAAASLAQREVKRVMRRISNDDPNRDTPEQRLENKRLAGIAAKATHANPLSALDPGIAQAIGYGNSYHKQVVDTLRYVTPMGHDVFTYLIVDNLASPHRKKLSKDGLNVSSWLQNLASFAGMACMRYPSINVHAILEYSVCRLRDFQVSELVVVKEIITSLSGIAMVHSLNPDQLESTAGGDTLRAESVAETGKTALRSSEQRRNAICLLNALQQGPKEDHLLVPLLVLLAQQRQHIATQTPNTDQLKLLLELFDQCSETLSQYIKFLQKYLPRDKYEQLLPSLDTLVTGFGLDVEVAWQVYRHLTIHLEPDTSASPEDGEVEEQEADASRDATGVVAPSTPPIIGGPTHIEDAGRDRKPLTEQERRMWQNWQANSGSEGGPTPMDVDESVDTVTWSSLVEASRRYLSDSTKSLIRPDFYLAFWSLRYYDIHVPEDRYKATMAAIRSKIVENSRTLRGGLGPREHDALEEQQVRLQGTLEKLSSEQAVQRQHVERVMARMHSLTEEWNSGATRVKGCNVVFIQDCVLPRCLYSPEDAAFAGTYLSLLTRLAVDWPVAFVYNTVFTEVLSILACTSEREAENLAITLRILLNDVTRWQEDPEAFGKECAISKGWSLDAAAAQECIAYSKFVQLYVKWLRLIAQMMVHCLCSGVYSQMRNALLVINSIRQVFPRSKTATDMLIDAIKNVLVTEKRMDLKTSLSTYQSWLENEQKDPNSVRNMHEGQFNKEQPPPEVALAHSSPEHTDPRKPDAKKERAEVMRERAEAAKEEVKGKKEYAEVKKEDAAAAAPAPSSAAPAEAKIEPAAEKPQTTSRKPPAVPASEGGKEKGKEKEHRSSKREPIPAQRTASIPAPSRKRPAHEPSGDQQPPTKEAKHAGAEAKSHTNGRLADSKSPQSTEKRRPSPLSPDAEVYVPRTAREGSSKPEEAAQTAAASTHRHHKRARAEEEPKKDRKKEKEREKEHDRADNDRSDKVQDRSERERDRSEKGKDRAENKGREAGPAPASQESRHAPSAAQASNNAAPASDPKSRAASRQPEGSSPRPHAAEADADGKRESRRDKEKRSEKDKKSEKEKDRDRGREPSKPSSRQGEEGRKDKESRHDKPSRGADKEAAIVLEAKRSAERPAKREAAEEPAPSSRKPSARRSETGEIVSEGQTSRHRKTSAAAEGPPGPRSEAVAAGLDADRQDRERQTEDSLRHGKSSTRERSVPRETGRRERSRIPAVPIPEGPRPLGAGLQNRLSRGPGR